MPTGSPTDWEALAARAEAARLRLAQTEALPASYASTNVFAEEAAAPCLCCCTQLGRAWEEWPATPAAVP